MPISSQFEPFPDLEPSSREVLRRRLEVSGRHRRRFEVEKLEIDQKHAFVIQPRGAIRVFFIRSLALIAVRNLPESALTGGNAGVVYEQKPSLRHSGHQA